MAWGRRLDAAREILWGHWWFRIALVVWAFVCGYDQLSGFVSQLDPRLQLPPLGPLAMGGSHLLPWWGWLLILQALVFASLAEYVVRHVQRLEAAPIPPPEPALTPPTSPTPPRLADDRFNARDQSDLEATLRGIRVDDTYGADIEFASNGQRRLAKIVAAIFESAGWRVQSANIPMEDYWKHDFITGIQVSGYNVYVVEAVAAALVQCGLPGVYTEIKEHNISPQSPKFPFTVHKVYVRLGHPERPRDCGLGGVFVR